MIVNRCWSLTHLIWQLIHAIVMYVFKFNVIVSFSCCHFDIHSIRCSVSVSVILLGLFSDAASYFPDCIALRTKAKSIQFSTLISSFHHSPVTSLSVSFTLAVVDIEIFHYSSNIVCTYVFHLYKIDRRLIYIFRCALSIRSMHETTHTQEKINNN